VDDGLVDASASTAAASSSGDERESSLRASTRAAVTFDVGSAASAHRAARDATARLVNETMWTWHCANTQNTPLPNADFVFWKDKQTDPVLTYVFICDAFPFAVGGDDDGVVVVVLLLLLMTMMTMMMMTTTRLLGWFVCMLPGESCKALA
jgi:hypothetical protein